MVVHILLFIKKLENIGFKYKNLQVSNLEQLCY